VVRHDMAHPPLRAEHQRQKRHHRENAENNHHKRTWRSGGRLARRRDKACKTRPSDPSVFC
jgi:hypothetical protein